MGSFNMDPTCNADDVKDGPIPANNDVAMSPETKVTATTSVGTITAVAGKGLKQFYCWEGATRSVEMKPRKERW
jgi:hypothetical protein